VAGESSDRMADLTYRMMAWTFRVADWLFPKQARLAGFGFQPGFAVVDYGCGPGRYLAQASRMVGPTGRVYAVDTHPLAIRDVERVKARLNLANVVPVLADGYTCAVHDHTADLIYALDMFHSVKDPVALLAEWHRIAKPQGVLVLEDGHQSRSKTKEKLARSVLWRIAQEEKGYVRCVAGNPVTAANLARREGQPYGDGGETR
jgi:ubiquinone/menaquinone biosynthesis C-methylase UbiE